MQLRLRKLGSLLCDRLPVSLLSDCSPTAQIAPFVPVHTEMRGRIWGEVVMSEAAGPSICYFRMCYHAFTPYQFNDFLCFAPKRECTTLGGSFAKLASLVRTALDAEAMVLNAFAQYKSYVSQLYSELRELHPHWLRTLDSGHQPLFPAPSIRVGPVMLPNIRTHTLNRRT
jgi:hypothetical protein